MTDPDISSMTPADLRRELAQRTNWRVVEQPAAFADSIIIAVVDPHADVKATYRDARANGLLDIEEGWRIALEQGVIPNWPGDDGDALRLILDVCGGVKIDTYSVPNTIIVKTHAILFSVLDTLPGALPLALSRLALLALRAQADHDR